MKFKLILHLEYYLHCIASQTNVNVPRQSSGDMCRCERMQICWQTTGVTQAWPDRVFVLDTDDSNGNCHGEQTDTSPAGAWQLGRIKATNSIAFWALGQ